MKKIITYSIIGILILFCGCSWRESFILKNNSTSAIIVSYSISQVDGLAIFDNQPNIYQSNKSGEIDWEKELNIEDQDTSSLGFQFALPANSILIFGHLSNDNYSNKDQYFINGRVFNFENMEIKKKDAAISISKDKFDSFFKKKNGYIAYEIK